MDFSMIRRFSKSLGGPDLQFLPEDRNLQEKKLRQIPSDIPLQRDFVKKARIILSEMQNGVLYEISLFQSVNYVALYSKRKHTYLIIGPTMPLPLKSEEFSSRMRRMDVPQGLSDTIEEEIRFLPVVPSDRLQSISTILGKCFLGTDEDIPYRKNEYSFSLEQKHGEFIISHSYEEIEKIRRVETRYEYSTAFTEAVKKGNLALAYEFIGHMNLESKDLQRARNPIRNAKNLLLAMNTQLRTAMQSIRIPPYRLDAISGNIAKKVENAMSIDELMKISRDIPRDYCMLSHESKYGEYPRLSREAAMLIKNNLSENISVEELSESLSVNADYLSYRFHEETGETIKDFVNRERCEQAATLLESTSMQIQSIANLVGYNSTSYFSKIFQRIYHESPTSYRKKGRM